MMRIREGVDDVLLGDSKTSRVVVVFVGVAGDGVE